MKYIMIFIWIPLLMFLYPLPPEEVRLLMGNEIIAELKASPDTAEVFQKKILEPIERKIWIVWWGKAVLSLVGVTVGVVALKRWRYWKEVVLGFSIICIALASLQYFFPGREINSSLLFFDANVRWVNILQANFKLVILGIETGDWWVSAFVFYKDFVLPLFESMVFVWIIRVCIRQRFCTQNP
jgi:hypothetical protein